MNQLQKTNENSIARLDQLAQEARMYVAGATMNMLQLGRVFIEVKQMLQHGEFAAWCEENAGCSIRTAENMMSAYSRFGDKPEFMSIGKSKLFKMLTLPAGTEEKFIAENDVAHMSSREVEQAIKETRGEVKNEPKETVNEVDEKLVSELRDTKADRDRIAESNKELIASRNKLQMELIEIRKGSDMDAELIQTQQDTIDQLNEELNRYRVSEARGEIGHISSDMNADTFRHAVQEFMGTVHQIPQMGSTFAVMDNSERIIFDTLLKSIEAWVKGARVAIDTVEGSVVL